MLETETGSTQRIADNKAIGIGAGFRRTPPTTRSMRVRTRRYSEAEQVHQGVITLAHHDQFAMAIFSSDGLRFVRRVSNAPFLNSQPGPSPKSSPLAGPIQPGPGNRCFDPRQTERFANTKTGHCRAANHAVRPTLRERSSNPQTSVTVPSTNQWAVHQDEPLAWSGTTSVMFRVQQPDDALHRFFGRNLRNGIKPNFGALVGRLVVTIVTK